MSPYRILAEEKRRGKKMKAEADGGTENTGAVGQHCLRQYQYILWASAMNLAPWANKDCAQKGRKKPLTTIFVESYKVQERKTSKQIV